MSSSETPTSRSRVGSLNRAISVCNASARRLAASVSGLCCKATSSAQASSACRARAALQRKQAGRVTHTVSPYENTKLGTARPARTPARGWGAPWQRAGATVPGAVSDRRARRPLGNGAELLGPRAPTECAAAESGAVAARRALERPQPHAEGRSKRPPPHGQSPSRRKPTTAAGCPRGPRSGGLHPASPSLSATPVRQPRTGQPPPCHHQHTW